MAVRSKRDSATPSPAQPPVRPTNSWQVSGLVVIWFGAMLVLEGKMTLGQLIAFRILSGYVTSPLLRLASLWQNFQETALSMERLADIVDHREEIEIAGENLPPIPPLQGAIHYEGVNFRFSSSGPPVSYTHLTLPTILRV